MSRTGVFLVIVAIIIVIWDLCAFVFGGEGSTVSAVLKAAGIENPGVLIGGAYIAGHIFSAQPCPKQKCEKCGHTNGQT